MLAQHELQIERKGAYARSVGPLQAQTGKEVIPMAKKKKKKKTPTPTTTPTTTPPKAPKAPRSK